MANINKIRLSGTTYDVQDPNATRVVSLTQAEYDALVTKDANTIYNITDATAGDLSNYYTKSETSGATEISTALADKANTATTYTKTEVDNAITAATATKQDTLVSGTNIKTINNESILGSGNITIEGGGKAVSAGTNISITTGETADTINCTLPISAGTNNGITIGDSETHSTGLYAVGIGHNSNARGNYSISIGSNTSNNGSCSINVGDGGGINNTNASCCLRIGYGSWYVNKSFQVQCGKMLDPKHDYEVGFGQYNSTSSGSTSFGHSGNTMFSIGNGYDFSSTHNWHNAFEIRQNGDVYIPNTDDTSVTGELAYSLYPMVRLQDTVTQTAANTTALGGLKLVKLTESEYDALTTKDSSTLYIIVN